RPGPGARRAGAGRGRRHAGVAGPGADAGGLRAGMLPEPAGRQARLLRGGLMPLGPELDAAELAALEDLAVDLAVRAGRFVRDGRPRDLEVSGTKATDLDVVTEMDTGAEALLREGITAARPDDAVLGEEEGATGGSTGLTWVIDPID